MDIKSLITTYIIDNLLMGTGKDTLDEDEQLLLDDVLDSISIFQLITYLQELCNITIPPEDVVLEHFATVRVISEYIEKRI